MEANISVKIIDPHCHLWDLSLGYHEWISGGESALLGSLKPINKNFLKEDYLKASKDFQVESVIHIESVSTCYALNEVEYLEETYKKDSFLGGVVAGADLLDENVESLLDVYSSHSLVKGVRQILNWSENPKYTAADRKDDLSNPNWQKNFGLLKKYNLSFDMQICPEQIEEVIQLVRLNPDVQIIVNHGGMPIAEYLDIWKTGMQELSRYNNVVVKLSGFGMFQHNWSGDTIESYIDYIVDAFGIDRCMFASNFPVDGLFKSYSEMMQAYLKLAAKFSNLEQEKLFYQNAKSIYRIQKP